MTIKELAVQYRHSIQIIKDRRAELRRAIKASEDPAEIEELQSRHRDLLLIERDIVVVWKHLKSYVMVYEKGGAL